MEAVKPRLVILHLALNHLRGLFGLAFACDPGLDPEFLLAVIGVVPRM